MTSYIQQAETAEPYAALQSPRFANVETEPTALNGLTIANDNAAESSRPNILVKRRRRHARLRAR